MNAQKKASLGISACLIGKPVRFNGSSKNNKFCTGTLAKLFELTPVCPEVEAGMGIPRHTIQLTEINEEMRAIVPSNGTDVSEDIEKVFLKHQDKIATLSGFVLTHKSPSCGVFRVKTYNEQGNLTGHRGQGLFAKALIKHFPNLPVEEAERLNDPALRENFILRIYAYHHWQQVSNKEMKKSDLVKFYTPYKYMMLSHSPRHYHKIGRLLAHLKDKTVEQLKEEFISAFMQGLSIVSSTKNHANALLHMQGYFKKYLSPEEKQELSKLIHAYRQGQVPLITPVTLLKHHLSLYKVKYLSSQKYFSPYPYSLGLRNHI